MTQLAKPTATYIQSLSEEDKYNYINELCNNRDCIFFKKIDIFTLLDPEEFMNASYYAPCIRKLLSDDGHALPDGEDDFEFIFNFIINQNNSHRNALVAYEKFINSEAFTVVYDKFIECEATYRIYFTDHFIKTCIRAWLLKCVTDDFFNYDAFDVLKGECHFTDTSPREALLDHATHIADSILFHNY